MRVESLVLRMRRVVACTQPVGLRVQPVEVRSHTAGVEVCRVGVLEVLWVRGVVVCVGGVPVLRVLGMSR